LLEAKRSFGSNWKPFGLLDRKLRRRRDGLLGHQIIDLDCHLIDARLQLLRRYALLKSELAAGVAYLAGGLEKIKHGFAGGDVDHAVFNRTHENQEKYENPFRSLTGTRCWRSTPDGVRLRNLLRQASWRETFLGSRVAAAGADPSPRAPSQAQGRGIRDGCMAGDRINKKGRIKERAH
jgi:hypothetical protein